MLRRRFESLVRRLVLTAVVAVAVAGCSKQAGTAEGKAKGGGPAVPVVAAEVVKKDMPVELKAIGNVRPSATVTVKPRVGGIIAAVNFDEGENVTAGDVLYSIDSTPFEVALAKAQATLAQVREQARNAEQQAKRYVSLGKSGAVAGEQLDQLESTARVSGSTQQAAEAAVKEAEIQLSYCTIKSPISGRTGRRLVDAGNIVMANTTEMVVVNQIAPIDVIFSVPEMSLADLNRYLGEGKLKVKAMPQGRRDRAAEGAVTFVDNTVKAATGTIDVKASFPNQDLTLWPGQFAEITVVLSTETGAAVVPARAVQVGQNGEYVFVVKPDKVAEMRPVHLSRTVGDEAVIAKGLNAGETVVTDGHLRVTPGARVELKPPVTGTRDETTTAKAGESSGSAVKARD